MLDSLLILKEILNILKVLKRKKEMGTFYYIVDLIVGIRNIDIFILAFLGGVWKTLCRWDFIEIIIKVLFYNK